MWDAPELGLDRPPEILFVAKVVFFKMVSDELHAISISQVLSFPHLSAASKRFAELRFPLLLFRAVPPSVRSALRRVRCQGWTR